MRKHDVSLFASDGSYSVIQRFSHECDWFEVLRVQDKERGSCCVWRASARPSFRLLSIKVVEIHQGVFERTVGHARSHPRDRAAHGHNGIQCECMGGAGWSWLPTGREHIASVYSMRVGRHRLAGKGVECQPRVPAQGVRGFGTDEIAGLVRDACREGECRDRGHDCT